MKEKNQRHYKLQGIEPIEIMRQNFSVTEYEGYLRGNVLKYLMRYQLKNGAEDLRKAMVYLEWLTELIEDLEDKTVVSGSDSDGELPNGIKRRSGRYPWGSGELPNGSMANPIYKDESTGVPVNKRVFNCDLSTGEWVARG